MAELRVPLDQRQLVLRRAEATDVHAIMSIDRDAYPTPWSRKMTIEQVTGRNRTHLVLERTDPGAAGSAEVIGHAGVLFLADEAHVSTIALAPTAQRQGHAHDLMLALVREAFRAGCRGLTLEVRATNRRALALYRRFGLAPAGIRRGYYGDTGEDALVLWSPDFDADYAERIGAMTPNHQIELRGLEIPWD